jgi:hypothetical protein
MKNFKYKKWLCYWNDDAQIYILYTPWEIEQPKEFRYPEMELETSEMCKAFIDGYNKY